MLEGVRDLGLFIQELEHKDPISVYVEELPPENTYLICIVLKKDSVSDYQYEKIEIEEYTLENKEKYLLRFGASQGVNLAPSAQMTDKDTFGNKILNWFNDRTSEQLKKIGECLKANEKKIREDIQNAISSIDKKKKKLLTLKFNENGNKKYVGDIGEIRDIFLQDIFAKFSTKYGVVSLGRNAICSLCLKKSDEVFGLTSDIFPFYTLDKFGFAPDFKQENGWKLYPVCRKCTLLLETGKKYLDEKQKNLSIYGGIKYYIIPRFILSISPRADDFRTTFFDLFEEYTKDPSFSRRERGWIGNLVSTEDRILELISEEKDFVSFDFIFYDRPNKKELKILLYINELLPSRLRKLYNAKNVVDNIPIFSENDIKMNFEIIYRIFPPLKNDEKNRYYLETVEKIFTGKSIDYHFLLAFLMRQIRNIFVNGWDTKEFSLKGLILLMYLKSLNVLGNYKGGEIMSEVVESEKLEESASSMSGIAEQVFSQLRDFFDSDIKKAIFLEGVLTQKLLKIQYQERKATPFMKKLNGLKLDEKKVRALLPAVQGKLEEYGKNYYRDLESLISSYFVKSGNNWNLTNDEISFYFVLGMNLANKFTTSQENVGGEKNE